MVHFFAYNHEKYYCKNFILITSKTLFGILCWAFLSVLIVIGKEYLTQDIPEGTIRILLKEIQSNTALYRLLYSVFAGVVCCYLSGNQIGAIIHNRLQGSCVCLLLVILFWGVSIFPFWIVNFFLLITCFYYIWVFVRNLWIRERELRHFRYQQKFTDPYAYKHNSASTFSPNVYFFYLESFSGEEVLNEIYGMDINVPYSSLRDFGFTIYDNVFANENGTLRSALTLFSGQHLRDRYTDCVPHVRSLENHIHKMLSWKTKNPVYEFFRANNYEINIFSMTDFLFCTGTNKFDYVSLGSNYYRSPFKGRWEAMQLNFEHDAQARIAWSAQRNQVNTNDFNAYLEQASLTKTSFNFIYMGALHTRCFWNHYRKGEWEQEYTALWGNAMTSVSSILNNITSRDPNALIVLLGDHGPTRYAGVSEWRGASAENIHELLISRGVSEELVAKDALSVLLAIRWPIPHFTQGHVLSHVNLFRHIFAALLGDPAILETCVPNRSYLGNYWVVNEGNPLSCWKRVA